MDWVLCVLDAEINFILNRQINLFSFSYAECIKAGDNLKNDIWNI